MKAEPKGKQAKMDEILGALREFKGITRKSVLGELLPIVNEQFYDDAGAITVGDVQVVVSSDGIVEGLVKDDPWLAGFYSVVVNVNDVVAKGARPVGYAHVLSSSSRLVRRQVMNGVKDGLEKYRLKFLKGHTHPDTSYDAVNATVVGIARNVQSSSTAQVGDSLVVAADLDGKFGLRSWVKIFDSVLFKTGEEVLSRLESIIKIAEEKLAHACRDISGPGVIGTIAMLCESSRVGAEIDIDALPRPENVDLQDWLVTYPSTGFVLTTIKPEDCVELLRSHGLNANIAGRILETKIVQILYQDQKETFINLMEESIFGLHKARSKGSGRYTVEVKELTEKDAPAISKLFKKVWSTAYEYPEEWRRTRILTEDQILKEMSNGYHYFGIKIDDNLAGVYKAIATENGLLGEHQSVDPDHRGLKLATAMYHHFIRFAKKSNHRKVCVNILINQAVSRGIVEKLGFRKRGQEYEQAKGMWVQMYEKLL